MKMQLLGPQMEPMLERLITEQESSIVQMFVECCFLMKDTQISVQQKR